MTIFFQPCSSVIYDTLDKSAGDLLKEALGPARLWTSSDHIDPPDKQHLVCLSPYLPCAVPIANVLLLAIINFPLSKSPGALLSS